jgi:hypothetical protein
MKMNQLAQKLIAVRNKVAQTNPEIADNINTMVNNMDTGNPMIETYAKPKANVNLVEDSGTVHSFSVEIKASKDGAIPDTQLMSKILQAVEDQNFSSGDETSEFAAGKQTKFEVVSFKYERRDDKKK